MSDYRPARRFQSGASLLALAKRRIVASVSQQYCLHGRPRGIGPARQSLAASLVQRLEDPNAAAEMNQFPSGTQTIDRSYELLSPQCRLSLSSGYDSASH